MHHDGAGPLGRVPRLVVGVLASLALALAAASAFASGPVSGSTQPRGPAGVSASSFGAGFAVMARFESLAKEGRGTVAVLLPGTAVHGGSTTVGGDKSDLERAFRGAGLSPTHYVVQIADESDATQYAAAVKDVSNGARVIVLDPINSGVGTQIEAFAKAHGVKVVDYDRLTLAGSRAYEVGFDTVEAGQLMGRGLVQCAAAWHVRSPHVVVMPGDTSDGAATLLAEGYDEVLNPLFKTGRWIMAVRTPGTSDPATAGSDFRSALSAHPAVNAAVFADEQTGTPIVAYLRSRRIRPRSFPTTSQGVTVPALDDILSGYLCGTVYESAAVEARAAVALALYLRAGVTPPRSLVNGSGDDTTADVRVPSVVLPPVWVTAENIRSTAVRDGTVRISQLCAGEYAPACKASGLSG